MALQIVRKDAALSFSSCFYSDSTCSLSSWHDLRFLRIPLCYLMALVHYLCFVFFFCVGSFPAADALGDTEFAFLYKVFSVALATTYAVLTTIFFPL